MFIRHLIFAANHEITTRPLISRAAQKDALGESTKADAHCRYQLAQLRLYTVIWGKKENRGMEKRRNEGAKGNERKLRTAQEKENVM